MLRNYLMPGFAFVLLAVFAAPRSAPSAAPEPGAVQAHALAPQQPTTTPVAAPAKVPPLEPGKPLFKPDDVCAVAMNEMHEKLGEFGLDYSEQTKTVEPSAANESGSAAEAMIALLPDPVHTHLALLFDRNVEVIQEALQDRTSEAPSGWIYTNQWLPWDPVPYQASQDPVERTNVHAFDAGRECAPGFLLFRRNRFQRNTFRDKFLVMFLVGESPTSGILRQDQFINAMRGWRAIERRDNDEPATTLRILGPSFSASMSTLDTLLLAQNCKAPGADPSACFDQAQVVSGSVAVSRTMIRQSGNFPGLSAANFVSMNESSDAVQEMLVNYFSSQQHMSPEEIAFVSEDETPFGNLSSSMLHTHNSGSRRERPLLFHYPREISQLRNAYEKNSIFSRQSSQQNTAAQNQQDLTLSLEDRHDEEDSVPSFSSTQNPVSEESVLSEMTRAMDRQRIRVAVINGTDVLDVIFVARYLGRNVPNVRVVLLNADLLFERSPDVSEFRGMLLANTYPLIPDNIQWTGRFLHMPTRRPDKGPDSGPDHPTPFGSFLPDRIFASFETTGIYNAARLLELVPFGPLPSGQASADSSASGSAGIFRFQTTRPRPAWDHSHNFLWLAEYSDPFRGGHHPPLWLNAVGRGGFWPVALLDRYIEEESPQSKASQADPCSDPPSTTAQDTLPPHSSLVEICAGNSPPTRDEGSIPPRMFDTWWWSPVTIGGVTIGRPEATQLLAARLSAVCLLALFILFGLILCVFARVDRWPQYVFDIPGTNGERRAWIVLVIILSYSWIARLLILDLPSYRFFRDPLNCGLLFLELVLLLFAVWLIRTGLRRGRRWAWACLLIALALLGQILFHWVKPREFAASLFYLYRSQHLLSGVCPVLPFIFLFIAVICLVSRHIHSLLVFSRLYKPWLPSYDNENSPPLLHFVTRENVKDMLLACYSPWRMMFSKRQQLRSRNGLLTSLLVLTTLMLLLSVYLLFPRGFETFETRSYSVLLSIFTFGIVLFMLTEIAWVALMWICLHKGLLIPLERSSLRTCFSRVSGFSWRRLWFSIDLSPAVRYKPLSRAHESMRRMLHDPWCPGEVKRGILYCRTKYAEYIKEPESNPVKRVHGFFKFQWALCRSATVVIATILSDPGRHREPLATSLDVSAKDIEDVLTKSAEDDSLEANAEEFVGLIYIYAIQHVLIDIRSHILAFTFSYFFLLMALSAYPVAPHHSIMVLLVGLLAAFVIAVVIIFSQMHRDSILSRTTSTEPGKLDVGFYEKLISVLGVPIIGLLASQFPEISNFLFSWLEPSLQTLK